MLLKGTFASPLLKHQRDGGEKKTATTQAIAKLFVLHTNANRELDLAKMFCPGCLSAFKTPSHESRYLPI